MRKRLGSTLFLFGSSILLSLAACAADDPADPEITTWQVETWPTGMADAIAAGDRTFALASGRWRLDLAGDPDGQPCEALDCKGPEDGWDPLFATEGEYDVIAYSLEVHRNRLWRDVVAAKSTVDHATGLGLGYGRGATFYRRALDGYLVVTELVVIDDMSAQHDFMRLAFADHGDRIQLVVEEPRPHEPAFHVPPYRIEIQTEPHAAVIETEAFAFRALKTDEGELPQLDAYEDLRGTPTAARTIELIERALVSGDAAPELVAEILHVLGHADPEVRAAAVNYTLVSYRWRSNPVSRVVMLDQLLARLQVDPDPTIRERVATGILSLASASGFAYHCILDEALEQCAASEAEPATATACQDTLDLGLERYGFCPWLDGHEDR